MRSSKAAMDFCDWATSPLLGTGVTGLQAARHSLLDTLACIRVAVEMPQSVGTVAALLANGDSGPVVPFGGGPSLSLTGAALVQGTRAGALDFDDYELAGSSHASAPILSAVVSVAAAQDLSIREVCEAWLVGYEALVAMGSALGYGHYAKGWHTSLTLGPVAVAAASARALRLDAARMAHAMALASSSSSGSLRATGFDAKALHLGFAAQAGLQAALLAQAGMTANTGAWDMPSGFLGLYGTEESVGFETALADVIWGQGVIRYPVMRKPWPSCAYTQRPIAAAQTAAARIGDEETVDTVIYRMPRAFHHVAHYGFPENDAQARFSVPYCLAAALDGGRVTPRDFRPEAYLSTRRRELVRRIELDLYDLPGNHSGDIGPTSPERLTVRLSSGRALEVEALDVPGGVTLPMDEAQLLQKAIDCGVGLRDAQELLHASPGEVLFAGPLRSSVSDEQNGVGRANPDG